MNLLKIGVMQVRQFFKSSALAIKAGLLIAAVIILFEVLNLFVLYRYLRMDYYLSFVAICFLLIGFWLRTTAKPVYNKQEPEPVETNSKPGLQQILTAREMEILQLIMAGKTNKEIAADHFIELSTVKTHINNIYSKLSVKNRQEVRAKYAQNAEK